MPPIVIRLREMQTDYDNREADDARYREPATPDLCRVIRHAPTATLWPGRHVGTERAPKDADRRTESDEGREVSRLR